MTKYYTKYVVSVNGWQALFNNPTYPEDIRKLTNKQAVSLFHKIDGELSPENLHCDGEISMAQANAKYNLLRGVITELLAAGFTVPSDCWEIDHA